MDDRMLEVYRFDAADYLRTEEDIRLYLQEVISENDPQAFLQALNTVARAKGFTALSQETGIPQEMLRQTLSEEGNPCFNTLWTLANALGCELVMRSETSCA